MFVFLRMSRVYACMYVCMFLCLLSVSMNRDIQFDIITHELVDVEVLCVFMYVCLLCVCVHECMYVCCSFFAESVLCVKSALSLPLLATTDN